MFDLSSLGVFQLLESAMTATHYQRPSTRCSPKRFSQVEIENAYFIRLVTSVKEYSQHGLEDYFKDESTCPVEMPLGLLNFKIINAHIDGSSKTCHSKQTVDDLER